MRYEIHTPCDRRDCATAAHCALCGEPWPCAYVRGLGTALVEWAYVPMRGRTNLLTPEPAPTQRTDEDRMTTPNVTANEPTMKTESITFRVEGPATITLLGITVEMDPPPEPPKPPMPLWGCRAKDQASPTSAQSAASYTAWDAKIGPLKISRTFEQTLTGQPYDVSQLPPGVIHWPSIKDWVDRATLEKFYAGVPQGSPVTYFHEPEANMAADVFRARFDAFYTVSKELRPDILVAYTAGAFQYRANQNNASDGRFFPTRADIYSIDTYRKGTDNASNAIKPLPDVAEFMTWYAYADACRHEHGAKLAISEYGRGRTNSQPNPDANAQRAAVIPIDREWLEQEQFWAWLPWLTDASPGDDWVPTDQPSLDALAAVGQAWA